MHPARQGNQPTRVGRGSFTCGLVLGRACIELPGRDPAEQVPATMGFTAPIRAADGAAVNEGTFCLPVKPVTAGRQAEIFCPLPGSMHAQRLVGSLSSNQQTHWVPLPAQSVRERAQWPPRRSHARLDSHGCLLSCLGKISSLSCPCEIRVVLAHLTFFFIKPHLSLSLFYCHFQAIKLSLTFFSLQLNSA
jgi:hypothetical protein